ncbi:NADH:flavin oxidoreductase/NADH oxidase [Thozetella sp. PMI_491]|nr:NADH:flavin oxidoreductase/NADH oxidase [Thozetella sp. PMI_491]
MTELQIASTVTLKCGLEVPNRLVKAALAERQADNYMPSKISQELYKLWADAGWGMVLTGNVQVDVRYTGSGADIAYDESVGREKLLEAWKAWADLYKGKETKLIMQICHPGRQSMKGFGRRNLWSCTMAPSPIPLNLGTSWPAWAASRLVFGTPREMTHADIAHVTRLFQDTARMAHEAGFAGVELHGAHGYLMSQFLSSKGNVRTDEYGGTPAKRAKFVVDIIRAVREAVPASFCVGIKLNSVDHQSEDDMAASLEQLRLITAAGVDFLEISGGDYENPLRFQMVNHQENFPDEKSERTKAREAFFLEFAAKARTSFPDVPLMVTGGFRSRRGMEEAVAGGNCDLIGLGRPAVLNPALPANVIFNREVKDQDAVLYRKRVSTAWIYKLLGIGRAVGAGAESDWYALQLTKLVTGR